jgi:integrase/recombinase XerD
MAANTTLTQQVAEFIDWCRARGLSPKTWRDAYGYPLKSVFLPWAERAGISDLAEVDAKALDRLATELHERQLSPASVKSYLKSVNQLMGWWEKQTGNKEARAQLPRLRKKVREVLSRSELDDLEAAAPTERDKLIIRLMADTGAREGEVAGLRVSDLIPRERAYFLKVRGKTGERMPPISPTLYRRLKLYAEKGRPRGAMTDRLFVTLRRRAGEYEALTGPGVYQVVKDAALRAGFTRPIFPHLIRHSAITWMVAAGMHPVAITDIVGCSLAMVTEVYSHLGDQQRYAAMMSILERQT